MANAYTDTGSSSLGGSVGGAGLVQKAYDRLLEFALRSEPLLRSVADKRPARQAFPGSTVVLQRYVDLDPKTSTLSETTDPDAVALTTPTSVTITLNEYGNAVLVTRALELFSLADVDPAIANIIAYNLADCLIAFSISATSHSMKPFRSSKKNWVLRILACWITLVVSPFLNMPPRPAVLRQAAAQPAVALGQV